MPGRRWRVISPGARAVWFRCSAALVAWSLTTSVVAAGEDSMEQAGQGVVWAKIQRLDTVEFMLGFDAPNLRAADIEISPPTKIKGVRQEGRKVFLTTAPLKLTESYTLRVRGAGERELQPDGVLDQFYSDKPLGCQVQAGKATFRLFAPRARQVTLELFERHDQERGVEYRMHRDSQGVWECTVQEPCVGKYYAYRVAGPQSPTEMFDPHRHIVDPYARAVVTLNHFRHPGKALILPEDDFDWEGDTWVKVSPRDLIIYELHVCDMTAHQSSGVPEALRGTYLGLAYPGAPGGIDYIKSLGVNAVELLPVHEFANMEPPYKDPTILPANTWNPYARNHWGYMTSYFFAPESYYATGGTMEPGRYCGIDGRQVRELKELVKAFHKAGIAVLLDVVYNHVAQYEWNCFKLIDKKYYFRLDDDQNFTSVSWCGNDFKTERPMARRLIIESVKYWMTEYHIDGFRFDLAALIDWETCEQIIAEARGINPDVILIAEAWGMGKYELAGFSDRGWASWNDQIRNGVKGQNPYDGLGFIFGKWQGGNNLHTIQNYVLGTLRSEGGLYLDPAHAVNYLESHDDHTFGDFVRIGNGDVREDDVVVDLDAHARLTERQMRLNKLGALFLFTSQGMVMMAEGQEFARSKVIARCDLPDVRCGTIDHNSYNKDDETNYLNYRHADINRELVDYYRGLIALRKAHPSFRRASKDEIHFFNGPLLFSFGYLVDGRWLGDSHDFVVVLNGDPQQEAAMALPEGTWWTVVDHRTAGLEPFGPPVRGLVKVPPTSGMVLRRASGE
ncbi:MAG: alpha-amylase family glycosyl hydrolase [bacterium]|nr:alpha-amylase family glycosyl hydrolase [candidate division KSB1 bacterium]MDH7558900.1 alpha-amylase family glycosyl hydrolase [bacterium]